MKLKSKIVFIILVTCVFFLFVGVCYIKKSKEIEDPLVPYQERLDSLNEELGVNYQLNIGDGTYEEMVDYITQMSLDEFEAYIKEAYEGDLSAPADKSLIYTTE